MHYVLRHEWGAKAPTGAMATGNVPHEAFLHHSEDANGKAWPTLAEKAQKMRDIQHFHQHDRGWSDIGYHWVIFQPAGDSSVNHVFQGREINFIPAAQLGHNTDTVAICVVGNGDVEHIERHTRYLFENVVKLNPHVHAIGGHRDVTATDCPGHLFYQAVPLIAKALHLATVK